MPNLMIGHLEIDKSLLLLDVFGVAVTLFLVLTNIFNTVTNLSPNTEGMTAIASWMLG